jgi:hypothetical protein
VTDIKSQTEVRLSLAEYGKLIVLTLSVIVSIVGAVWWFGREISAIETRIEVLETRAAYTDKVLDRLDEMNDRLRSLADQVGRLDERVRRP